MLLLIIVALLLIRNVQSEQVDKGTPSLKEEDKVNDVTVGLFIMDNGSEDIYELFNNFGVKTVLVNYNKIINLKEIRESFTRQDEILFNNLMISNKIKVWVSKFIKKHKINRIFISDNSHLSPNPHLQLINEMIVKLVNDNPKIHLLAICSSIEGIMHTKGVEITNISNNGRNNSKLPQKENIMTALQQIKIVPGSHLEKVLAKFLLPNQNGWLSTYFPSVLSGTIKNSRENRIKLELLGYKVAAFSDKGVIEAIEDSNGNIYFHSHLEALLMKKNDYFNTQKTSILAAIAIINDFLNRA